MNTLDCLAKIPIFSTLSSSDLDPLTRLWHQRTLHASEILFRKGDVGTSMFIIDEGTVEITVPGGDNQKEIRVSVLHDGDFLGELSLINGSPRTATATVIRDCTLLEMNREDFFAFLAQRPQVAISMMGELGKRLQATNDLVTSIASKNINIEMDEQMSFGDKLADRVADFVGSWTFLIYYLIAVAVWCALNVIQLMLVPFDPYPFVFLNLVLGLIASLQAPLIMMSQNRAQTKDRLKVDMDYQVNLKSELLLQQLLAKMDAIRSTGPLERARTREADGEKGGTYTCP
jgi:CRP/FNR family cyclic AMP-dependent transcriptional regulator